MQIAIPAESMAGETRVAASPETVKKMIAMGHRVVIETGAGLKSSISDADYIAAGASIAVSRQDALSQGDIILKVRAADTAELQAMKADAVLIAQMNPYGNPHMQQMAAHKLSVFAMELMPRTTLAQSMDVLSSQNNVAGYRAVLLALQYYPHFMPMLMTAAGTVKPARVLVLGVGVAGLQAIATAKRLGAVVEAFDVRPSTKEQVESLGAKFIEVPMTAEEKALSDGVYAKEMSESYKQRQAELVDKQARLADIVITTALIPGRPAPRLVSAKTVLAMKRGSVVVDLAAESGGNCEVTRAGSVIVIDNGVTIVGSTNLPGMLPADASSLYARNLFHFLSHMLTADGLAIKLDDELVRATLIVHQGEIRFPSPQHAEHSHVTVSAGEGAHCG